MKVQVAFKIGGVDYRLEVDEKDEMDSLHKGIVLGNPPRYCQECKQGEEFKLDTNKDKEGNTYINVVCLRCFAKSKLGQYKSGGYFWHKFARYTPKVEELGNVPKNFMA